MGNLTLADFISAHREELIGRCRIKVMERLGASAPVLGIDKGIPLFLEQLVRELHQGPSETQEINAAASQHGQALLAHGLTVSDVVHGYGDVCQSVTDLAVETNAPIDTEDFRTLNRCLDDAIAGAVTEYAREDGIDSDEAATEMRALTQTALTAFEVLRLGRVGVAGSTGAVLYRSLRALSALLTRTSARTTPPTSH